MVKKIITMLILLLMMSSATFGAVSEDMSVYVRKDVYDAKMEAFMSEIRLMNEQVKSEIRALSSRIDGIEVSLNTRIDSVEKRMSNLEVMIYWILGTLSVAFAALALAPYLKDIRKPFVTLEDVKRLIEEQLEKNNAELRKSIQL